MKEFWDFIVKNKYIIICVLVVVILYALGIVGWLVQVLLLIALVLLAIYIGKRLQDDDSILKNIFRPETWKKEEKMGNNVYYYQDKSHGRDDD